MRDALHLADAGLSVIPLKPRSKVPTLKSWKVYQSVAASKADIATWWLDDAASNVAIVTGQVSNVIVLDADDAEAVADIQAKGIPQTWCATTRAGRHWYLRWPGFAVTGTIAVPGIAGKADVRADGNYVVAPPSIHETGHRYEWLNGPADTALAPCPTWLLELLHQRQNHGHGWHLDSPELKARQAWHGGAPGIGDLSRRVRRLIVDGDHDGTYHRRGSNQTLRVAGAIIGGCAERGLGVQKTVKLLAGIVPPPRNDGTGRAWYGINAARKGRIAVDRDVAQKYANMQAADNVVAAWQVRDELQLYREQILDAEWGVGDSSLLKTLCAVLAISWEAASFSPDAPTRRVADLANVDHSTAGRCLHRLSDEGWLDLYSSGVDQLKVDLRLGAVGASEPYLSAHRLCGANLHALLHPVFDGGTKTNPVVWLALDAEPRSVADIAERVGSTSRTVRPHLTRLAQLGLAIELPYGWRAITERSRMDLAAITNGGREAWVVRRKRHVQQRRDRRASREPIHVAK